MFLRLWLRSLVVKRPQALLALASLAVGAAVASLLLNLYGGARRKMTDEFRAYGANVIVEPGEQTAALATRPAGLPGQQGAYAVDNNLLDETVMTTLRNFAPRVPGLVAAPVLYVVVHATAGASTAAGEGVNLVAVGPDFATLRKMNPGWHVESEAIAPQDGACVVGAHAAARLGLGVGGTLLLQPLENENRNSKIQTRKSKLENPNSEIENRKSGTGNSSSVPRVSNFDFRLSIFEFQVSALLTTGAAEDDQVFVPLHALQTLAGLQGLQGQPGGPGGQGPEGKLSLIELNVPGPKDDVERAVRELRAALADSAPGAAESPVEVRAVPQILASQGRVLDTLRGLLLSLSGLILAIVALSVTATVTVIVLERRRDVAVMKALGATDRLVMGLFLSEVSALGFAGGLLGFGAGALLARDLGRRLFGVTLNVAWWTLPAIAAAGVFVAVLSTLAPVRSVRSVSPAMVLKGE